MTLFFFQRKRESVFSKRQHQKHLSLFINLVQICLHFGAFQVFAFEFYDFVPLELKFLVKFSNFISVYKLQMTKTRVFGAVFRGRN